MNFVYLLDTNIVSNFMAKKPDANVSEIYLRNEKLCAISAISLQEMIYGARLLPDGARKSEIMSFIVDRVEIFLPTIPYGKEEAEVCGDIRAAANRAGIMRPYSDSQIAATAIARGMTLVTRNTRDFEPFARIAGLRVENWFAPN